MRVDWEWGGSVSADLNSVAKTTVSYSVWVS